MTHKQRAPNERSVVREETMAFRQIGWGALAAGIAWLGLQTVSGTSPVFAQAPAQPPAATPAPTAPTPAPATPPAQAPTLGAHEPQAAGAPSWMEGMTPEQKNSALHPNV